MSDPPDEHPRPPKSNWKLLSVIRMESRVFASGEPNPQFQRPSRSIQLSGGLNPYQPPRKRGEKEYKYMTPPENPEVCCFDWLPPEIVLEILSYVRVKLPMSEMERVNPLLERDQWSCAMTCRLFRTWVDPEILAYLSWAAKPHDFTITHLDSGVSGMAFVKYFILADSDDHALVSIAERRVHNMEDINNLVTHHYNDHKDLLFAGALGGAGSKNMLTTMLETQVEGARTMDISIVEFKRFLHAILGTTIARGHTELAKFIYGKSLDIVKMSQGSAPHKEWTHSDFKAYMLKPAMVGGKDFSAFKWIIATMPKWVLLALEQEGIAWILESHDPVALAKLLLETECRESITHNDLLIVVQHGSLELLQVFHEYHARDGNTRLYHHDHIWRTAAMRSRLDILEWAHSHGYIPKRVPNGRLFSADVCRKIDLTVHDEPSPKREEVRRWLHTALGECSCLLHLVDCAKATFREHVLSWANRNKYSLDQHRSVCLQAIRMQDWELLEWALRNGHGFRFFPTELVGGGCELEANEEIDSMSKAMDELISRLDDRRLQNLYELGVIPLVLQDTCAKYIRKGKIDMLKWAIMRNTNEANSINAISFTPLVALNSFDMRTADLGLFEWLYDAWRCQDALKQKSPSMWSGEHADVHMLWAAKTDDISYLSWAHSHGLVVFQAEHILKAIHGGHTKMAQWIYETGGDFECLLSDLVRSGCTGSDFVKTHKCLSVPFGRNVMVQAMKRYRLDILNYCYENKCPFRPRDLWEAARTANDSVLRDVAIMWLKERPIPKHSVMLCTGAMYANTETGKMKEGGDGGNDGGIECAADSDTPMEMD